MEGDMDDIYEEKLELDTLINVDFMEEWYQLCQMCVVQLICYIVPLMHLLQLQACIMHKPLDEAENIDVFSSEGVPFNQFEEISSSRGFKQKVLLIDLIEKEYERLNMRINNLINVIRDLGDRHIQIAERRLSILENSKPRYYSETDVWKEIEDIGVPQEFQLKYYCFLCDNEKAKKQFFGVPSYMRLQILYQLMANAGVG